MMIKVQFTEDEGETPRVSVSLGFVKIDGEEAPDSGERHLWRALSRRHHRQFAWFLLHLKGGNATIHCQGSRTK